MNDTFKSYLARQKAENKYSSSPSKELLGEGIFDNKKYECYAVKLDFTDKALVKIMTDALINEYKSRTDKEGKADPVKSLIAKGTDGFKDDLRNKVTDLVINTIKSTKSLKTFFGLGKESSALASVEVVDDSVLKYIFFPGPKKNPKAFAERFIDEIGRDPDVAILKSRMDIIPETFYKGNLKKSREDNIFFKAAKEPDNKEIREKIKDSGFINGIVATLGEGVEKHLKTVDEQNEKGNLISVFSVPYKIDDELIDSTAKESKNIDEFYTKLADKINKELVATLKQVSKIDDYFGFIPTKTYGFNLYFKDKDVATDIAEKLNQDGNANVSERKRYEKKMTKLYQLLGGSSELSGLSHPEGGMDEYFRGTLFARTRVAARVKDRFPGIEDQVSVTQYVVKYDEGELKQLLTEFDLDSAKEDIRAKVKQKLQEVLSNLQKVYEDELISMGSEGSNLIFFFKKTASTDAVKAKIASVMSCNINRINVMKTAMTKKEMDTMHSKISELENLESFYMAVEKLTGNVDSFQEERTVIRYDIVMNPEYMKAMATDKYEDAGKKLIEEITDKAKTSEGFLGITVPGEDDGTRISLYFKDEASFTTARENIMQIKNKAIKNFTDPEKVKVRTRDIKNLTADPTTFIEHLKNLYAQNQEEESKKTTKILQISLDKDKLGKIKIRDFCSNANDALLKMMTGEGKIAESANFGLSLKHTLMESIHLITESEKDLFMAAKQQLTNMYNFTKGAGNENATFNDYASAKKENIAQFDALCNNVLRSIEYRLVEKPSEAVINIKDHVSAKIENYTLTIKFTEKAAKYLQMNIQAINNIRVLQVITNLKPGTTLKDIIKL